VIQIKPYNERLNRDEILKAYLALLEKALPFFKEDLHRLAAEKFELDPSSVRAVFPNRPPSDAERRKGIDAERTIQNYSENLHGFLYGQTVGDGRVNIDRLYELLTVPMIEEVWARKGMDFALSPPETDTSQLLNQVFRYEAVSGDKQRMYAFTKQLKTEVCPYCNRIFTATVLEEESSQYAIRPQLDHFKNKNRYPFFALSIMNLVPSCSFCNQRKSTKDIKILYPYVESAGCNYVFRTYCTRADGPSGGAIYVTGAEDSENSFTIRGEIDPSIPDKDAYSKRLMYIQRAKGTEALSGAEQEEQKKAYIQRLNGSAGLFCWEAACQHHKAYVLRMFRQNYWFGKEYSASLGRSFRNMFSDPTLTYLRDIRKEHWGDEPLAKLTHDIDLEIQAYNGVNCKEPGSTFP